MCKCICKLRSTLYQNSHITFTTKENIIISNFIKKYNNLDLKQLVEKIIEDNILPYKQSIMLKSKCNEFKLYHIFKKHNKWSNVLEDIVSDDY